MDVKEKEIFNPFSGSLSFASNMKGFSKFTGIELNPDVHDYSLLLYSLKNDDLSNVNVRLGDVKDWTNEQYDVIVTNPPYNMRMNTQNERLTNSSVISLEFV